MAGPWENYGPHVAEPAVPPVGLKPGTQGYLDWAIEQSKAGRTLPKLSFEEMVPPGATLVPGWETPGAGEPLNVGPLSIPPGIPDMIRSLYPFERNVKTGQYRPAIPKVLPAIIDSAIECIAGRGGTGSEIRSFRCQPGADRAYSQLFGICRHRPDAQAAPQ